MKTVYVPAKIYKWESLSLESQHPLLPHAELLHDGDPGVGFMVAFKTRKEAEEYASTGYPVDILTFEIPDGYEI